VQIVFQPPPRAIDRWPGGFGQRELTELAAAADEAGFDAIAMTDHPFPPDAWLANGGHHALDPFAALAFVAAKTHRIRLLTNLVVAGYRNPYLTAKLAATVDVLSGGRLVLGMGAGYLSAEFTALGAEHCDRGIRFDAALDAMRAAWTGETVRADGPFAVEGHTALPRPVRGSGPPIWIGGNSVRARRRAALHADGWMPFQQSAEQAAITGTDALAGLDELAERIADLDRARREHGRSRPLDVCFAPRAIGSSEAVLRYLSDSAPSFAAAGVNWLVWQSSARSLDSCLEALADVGSAGVTRGRRPG
jgi:probable F420-dependent oxidoreductase